MKKSVFSQWFVVLLLCSTLGWWTSVSIWAAGMDKGLNAPAPSNDPTAIAAIRQVGRDMGDAMVAGDIDKLNQIYADDWAGVGSSGQIFTKEKLLSDFRSGKHRLVSYELGPIDVQVFGNVAVAHGGVTEKRSDAGKDTSGQYVYMDLLKKRANKWVVVRSAGTKAVSADSPKAQSQDPSMVETMKQFAQDTGSAMVAVDIDKLNHVYADDWATIGPSGTIFTKQMLLDDFKSGRHKLLSFEIGPMNVQVFGKVAVVDASVTEKRLHDGKDISGEFVFTDLLENRAGKWVIVRTLGARVS